MNLPHRRKIPSALATPSKPAAGRRPFTDCRSWKTKGFGAISELPFRFGCCWNRCLRNCDGYEVTEDDVRESGRLECRVAGRDRDSVQAGPRRAAGFYRRAVRRRSGRHAQRHEAAGRRSARRSIRCAGRSGDRPLGAGRSLRHDRRRWQFNVELEFERNRERYEFLRWGQKAFDNFRVVPPAVGHRASGESRIPGQGRVPAAATTLGQVAVPDTLVGTDSHTTMINGLGVVGWGVGGIEAEAVMLGQPLYHADAGGRRLRAHRRSCRAGATATDLVLTVTQILRKAGRGRTSSSSSSGRACRA